jgi:hypothetical protein
MCEPCSSIRCASALVFQRVLKIRTAAFAVAIAIVAGDASAQITQVPRPASTTKIAAVNVALGALTAGTWSAAKHKSFWRGFARGGAARGGVFVGKQLIGEGNPTSWWFGRQIAALGSSEVVNAGEGLPFLQRAVIPVGPLRFHVDRLARRKIVPKIDIGSVIAGIAIASRDRTRFALNESLASGVIVFVSPETSQTVGTHMAGIIRISELLPDGKFPPLAQKRTVMSHELIHTVQYDFVFTAWSDHAQQTISKKIPAAAFVSRYFDINLTIPLQLGVNGLIDYSDRPWEREASSFARE